MKKDSFSSFHPVVNFTYFTSVIIFSMFFMHPVFLGIALFSSCVYSVLLKGKRAVRFNVFYMLPMLLLMAFINPLFNHQGSTMLFYLKDGNPVTLESLLYGAASACMFITVILWFSCYNTVMTSDKFIYLFGKIIPSSSLIFSMVLRFVPRFKVQLKVISDAQKCLGRDVSQGNMAQRAKNGIRILSIMTTWALENAIETADSMKARGYGLPKRTSFSIFRVDQRDKITLGIMAVLTAIILIGASLGYNTMRFFPTIKFGDMTPFGLLIYLAWFTLCMLPVIADITEEVLWKYTESKI